jgi:tetratricopeptide (TPR) repeat protein
MVYNNMTMKAVRSLLNEARSAEEEDRKKAISLYEQAVKANPLSEEGYNRLMMLYRKGKEYEKEFKTIETAIRQFEKLYSRNAPKGVKELSDKLNKSLLLTNKKGIPYYDPEPIATWKKRKQVIEKKLGI